MPLGKRRGRDDVERAAREGHRLGCRQEHVLVVRKHDDVPRTECVGGLRNRSRRRLHHLTQVGSFGAEAAEGGVKARPVTQREYCNTRCRLGACCTEANVLRVHILDLYARNTPHLFRTIQ